MNRSVELEHLRPTALIITAIVLAVVGWLATTPSASAGQCTITSHVPTSTGTLVTAFGEADCAAPNDHTHVLEVALKIDRSFQPDPVIAKDSASGTTHIQQDASGCDGGSDDYYTESKVDGGNTTQSARDNLSC